MKLCVLAYLSLLFGTIRLAPAAFSVLVYTNNTPVVITDRSPGDLDPTPGSIQCAGTVMSGTFFVDSYSLTAKSTSPDAPGDGMISLSGTLNVGPATNFLLISAQDTDFSLPAPGLVTVTTSMSGTISALPSTDFSSVGAANPANVTIPNGTPPPTTRVAFYHVTDAALPQSFSVAGTGSISLTAPYALAESVELSFALRDDNIIPVSFSAQTQTSVPEPQCIRVARAALCRTIIEA